MSFTFFGIGRRYRHVFFDLDRTLWDFEQNMVETLNDLYIRHDLAPCIGSFNLFLDSFRTHNERLWAEYRRGNVRKEVLRNKRFELVLNSFGMKDFLLSQRLADEYMAQSPLKTNLVPHSVELLEYLHKRYYLYIITNGFSEVQQVKLDRSGIAGYFKRVVTSEMVGSHKPKPEVFGYSLSQAGARKRESIMVGDDLEIDILGAQRFGMDQIYFNPSAMPHNHKITYEVRSLYDIIGIL